MELQRKEYPAMLDSLQPNQAIAILNDRMKHVSKVNTEIADWLQERRRIEEQYALGMRKLAQKLPADSTLDLGVFTSPWNKIISSVEAIADSHDILASKIELDVERNLREFVSKNREVQAMSSITGNLASMAKDVDAAQKKVEKLDNKGGKVAASKVAAAAGDVESAIAAWDSQAPYVFEKLQAVDESRLNQLRDALTQLQTLEVDQVERNRHTAEQCLNVLLNIDTADETKTFSIRAVSGRPKIEKQRSRNNATGPIASTSAEPPLPPSTPAAQRDDGSSHKSSIQEQKSSRSGLKRFTTVLGRRRQSLHPYQNPRGPSPEQKSSPNLASSLFGRNKHKEIPERPQSPAPPPSQHPRTQESQESPSSPKQSRPSVEGPNGTPNDANTTGSSDLINGMSSTMPRLQEPLQPISPTAEVSNEPRKDSEGFSVPPSAADAISQAEQEAASSGLDDAPQPQFKVDIRNAPIQEEDGDAETALANVANTLRAQAIPTRKTGTIRGRRAGDVRNTMFVPAGQNIQLNDTTGEASIAPTATVPQPLTPTTIPVPSSPPTISQHSPFRLAGQRAPFLNEDPAASDTQSVRSGRSLSSSASATIRHPDLHGPGLNSSVVETVSTWFEHGQLTKALVIGQVALAFNPIDISSGPFGTEIIRLENFPVLEKVAPNPAFIEQASDQPGVYTVDLSKITKTSVAFHYQVHLETSNRQDFSPLLLSPVWKAEPTQTSALVSYSLNPSFALLADSASVTISNLVLVLRLDPTAAGRSTHAQSKPVGNFSRDRALIYWRLGDVTLTAGAAPLQLRVRFFTEGGQAKPGNVEARWEIDAVKADGVGSGLTVSQRVEDAGAEDDAKEKDPFADDDEGGDKDDKDDEKEKRKWKGVQGVKKIASGTYVASP